MHRPVIRAEPEGLGGALEGFEYQQSAFDRELPDPRHHLHHMGVMQDQGERLGGAPVEFGQLVEHRDDVALMAGPSRRGRTGADFKNDHVDRRIALEDVEDPDQVTLARSHDRARRVHRIAIAAANRVEESLELIVRGLRQRGHVHTGTGEGVGDEHRLAAGHRHQADPTSFDWQAQREHRHRVEQRVPGADLHRSTGAHNRLPDLAGGGQRRRVREGGARAGCGHPALPDDHRMALGSTPQHFQETAAVADSLHVHANDTGGRIFSQQLQIIRGLEHDRITDRSALVELHPPGRPLKRHVHHVRAALGNEADVAAGAGRLAGKIAQPDTGVVQAHAVGADQRDIRLRRDRAQLLFQLDGVFLAGFGKARGEELHAAHAGIQAILEDHRRDLTRHCGDREIDRTGHVGEIEVVRDPHLFDVRDLLGIESEPNRACR